MALKTSQNYIRRIALYLINLRVNTKEHHILGVAVCKTLRLLLHPLAFACSNTEVERVSCRLRT